ncbi:MAG: TIGR01777 family oxidoreductase [Candidatus Pacebacteria bacterium]|nr:TIGR01777 family oxidoreductase [Candidatus Paceibacterota bacterium]MBP9701202.1 TIGR01777 family oxidoreductase [Candidatus Paceibacterota bacterium]
MTIVLTGGSGFIGTQLSKKLLALGDTVIVVDRFPPRFTHEQLFFIQCDITTQQLPFNVLEHTDAVINLAGEPISQKWTLEKMKAIRNSRIISTRHIVQSMHGAINRPTIFICASAVGYYGERGDEELTERSAKGTGFLADVVSEWEIEAHTAENFGTRVVSIRTAPVVGHGGMIAELKKSARFGFLLKLSSKDFWQAWIHEDDIVNAYLFALQTSTLQGVVNAAAPEQVTHSVFMQTLGHAISRKVWGTIPQWIGKALFGELLDEMTKSQRVSPQLLIDKGFVFTYPTLTEAMQEAVKK